MPRLWLLRLTPDIPGGRWLIFGVILLVMLALYQWGGAFFVDDAINSNWDAALFFAVILAYIVPIMAFITAHTEACLDQLRPYLDLSDEQFTHRRHRLAHRSWRWVVVNSCAGLCMWLLQGTLLFDGWSGFMALMMADRLSFLMSAGPLLVWMCVTCAIHVLVDNAMLFRRLVPHVQVEPLDMGRFNPFGRMAVTSTLVVVGAQASFVILWLGDATDPWTTIPGIAATSLALVMLIVLPIWPAHVAMRTARRQRLSLLQSELLPLAQQAEVSPRLTALLLLRREVADASEWPFDVSIVARLSLYLVLVPLTWIGAALIEIAVDMFLS